MIIFSSDHFTWPFWGLLSGQFVNKEELFIVIGNDQIVRLQSLSGIYLAKEYILARFQVGDLLLNIPMRCMNGAIRAALESGRYEHKELAALQQHLMKGDRVLELGGGAGYLALHAAKIVGPQNVATVEAHPDMVHAIKKNLELNIMRGVEVLSGAVVADEFHQDFVSFEMRAAFWSSRLHNGNAGRKSVVMDVPALKLRDICKAFQPSFVMMDIEGAEADLAQQDWVESVRLIMMEIHPDLYGPQIIQNIFDGLSRAGFAYMPAGSQGNIVVFQRVTQN